MRRYASPASIVLLLLSFLAAGSIQLLAQDNPGEILFESESLRIYRVLTADGTSKIVLTNLDEEGELLSPESDAAPVRDGPAPPCGRPPDDATADRTEPDRSAVADVVAEITSGAQDGTVVTVEEGDGTTIVINVNPPAPPPAPEPVVVPVLASPVIALGGVAGAFRYPERQPFLGHGPGIGSPSWLGGLVLNAGNGFGLQTGRSCHRGFDCMFPPTSGRP